MSESLQGASSTDLKAIQKEFAGAFPLHSWETSLRLDVGGIVAELRGADEFLEEIRERYTDFLTDAETQIILEVVARERDRSAFSTIEVTSLDGKHYARRWDFEAEIDTKRGVGYQFIHPQASPLSVDALVRIAYSMFAVNSGAFLLHSCGILAGNEGFLFCGVSGSGKSTVAKLSSDYDLLTDEMVLVSRVNGHYEVSGTPFWGELATAQNKSGPIRAIFALRQDTNHSIETLPFQDAMRELMSSILFFATDPDVVTKLFEISCQIVAELPLRRLHFAKDSGFWRCIHAEFR